jgi:hypothetical protein
MQATLALRLAPQARVDPKTAGRQQEYRGPRPWDINGERRKPRGVLSAGQAFNQLGRFLPAPGDIDPDDIEAVAEARMIIAEMHKTRAEMDGVLAAEAKLRSANG